MQPPQPFGRSSRNSSARERARLGVRRSLAAGFVTFLLAMVGGLAAGHLSGGEAIRLLETMMPTVRFFISSIMTAAATILALMLTLLSLSLNSQSRLKAVHYKRIQHIALADTMTFIASTVFMIVLLISVPMEETDTVPTHWFEAFYYVVLGLTAALGGMLVGVVVMLFSALRDMINVLALGKHVGTLLEIDDED